MATFVVLFKYTDQGIKNIKDAPSRVEANRKAAAALGVNIKEVYWLQGEYDFMAISETDDELTAAALTLNVLKQGNVTATTLRAFSISEMEKILEKVA